MSRNFATNLPAGDPIGTTRSGCHFDIRFPRNSANASSMSGCAYRAMSSDTSSRSTAVPNSRLIVDSNAVECVVNGGALLPNECTINTRRGRSPSAPHAPVVAPARNSAQSKTGKVRSRLVRTPRQKTVV